VQIAVLTKMEAEKAIKAFEVQKKQKNHENLTQFPGHFFKWMSFDLGITSEKVEMDSKNNQLNVRGEWINFFELEKMKKEKIYALIGKKFFVAELFDEKTNLYYKLKPTGDWPTVTLSSVPMHRFKHFSPKESAELMVKSIFPVSGTILDTCAGLGYTSILCANLTNCVKVITFEKDNNVLELAKFNPFSEELFSNKKIELHKESVFEGVKKISDCSIDGIIHDPPTVSFAPDLYSKEFYKELFRVLKPNKLIYHYCPNPGKTKGKEFWRSIKKRLAETGFKNINYLEKSSGIAAEK
jgi:predicted methyltransferase